METLQLSPASGNSSEEIADFEQGLLDLRRRAGLYVESEHGVEITEGVLYRARLPLPARVPVGTYVAQTFLVQNGNVVAEARREITIDKSGRSEEHTSELQSLMRISYAVFCLKKKKNKTVENEATSES